MHVRRRPGLVQFGAGQVPRGEAGGALAALNAH